MIAPRKKLWSSPHSVVDAAIQWAPLKEGDCVVDIGCGDGRCIMRWAQAYSANTIVDGVVKDVSFVGIDIDEARIAKATEDLHLARKAGTIHDHVRVEFHVKNGLEAKDLLSQGTVFFLYLIPRGLRIVKPLILDNTSHSIRIVTYMSPLPEEEPIRQERIRVAHQDGAAWPLFYYEFNIDTAEVLIDGEKALD